MNSQLFADHQAEFESQTGLKADANPTAYVEYVKMLAQELIYKTLVDIKLELQQIKQKID